MEEQQTKKLNILVVSQYFWPENFRVNDLVKEFVEKGHTVTVLTGKPNYPDGVVFNEYKQSPKDYLNYFGAQIIRVPMLARGTGGARLLLNYFSFCFSASVLGPYYLRKNNIDVIFVFQGSPVTVAIPAIVIKKIKKVPIIHWVLDLWPDTLAGLEVVKSKFVFNLVGRLVSFIYNSSDLVLGQSKAFLLGISRYCFDVKKIRYFANWSEDIFTEHDVLPAKEIPNISIVTKFLFAGNVGESQDFATILNAAELLVSDKRIHIYVVGDGRVAAWVSEQIKIRELTNITMLGRFPLERMPSFYKAADVLVASLKANPVFAMTIPGKIQSYMAAGKPIIGLLDGEGARVIQEANCGLSSGSGDHIAFANNLVLFVEKAKDQLVILGENGRQYALREFDRKQQLKKLEDMLYELVVNNKKAS